MRSVRRLRRSGGSRATFALEDLPTFHSRWSALDLTEADTDPVGTFVNRNATNPNITAAGVNRGTFVAADPSVLMDGLDDFYRDGVASDWSFLHDGSGMAITALWEHTAGSASYLSATGGNTGVVRGTSFLCSASNMANLWITNGATAVFFLTGTTPQGSGLVTMQGIFRTGRMPTEGLVAINGNIEASGNAANAPSASAPAAPLHVGSSHITTAPLNGKFRDLAIFEGDVSTADLQAATQQIVSEHGLSITIGDLT